MEHGAKGSFEILSRPLFALRMLSIYIKIRKDVGPSFCAIQQKSEVEIEKDGKTDV